MKRRLGSFTLGLAMVLLMAPSLAAQAWYFPDFALPSSSGEPATWIAGTYGRGLNDHSGEVGAFGAAIGRTAKRVTFMGAFGHPSEHGLTAGASLGVDLNTGEGPQLSAQVGVGWMDTDPTEVTPTFWRIPIGLALKGSLGSETTAVIPWVMPRLNISYATGGGDRDTETDFGASGGVYITMENGLGFHGALDALFVNSHTAWLLGLGVHYVLGSQS